MRYHLLGVSLIAIAAAVPAAAQTGPQEATQPGRAGSAATQPGRAAGDQVPGSTGTESDIIVTAQRRAERLQDVPIAIQAFSGAQLEASGIRNVADLITQIPGASEGRGNTAGIQTYQIRGVSSFYGDSTIGYYVDEAAYVIPNRNYAPVVRAFDIDRVEVLRGPQGTLYGLGSMGGTIRFITAQPDLDEFHARGLFTLADTNGGKASGSGDAAVSVPLVPGKVAVRGSVSYDHWGGYAESPSFPGDKNDVYMQDYRAKLLAKPTDAWTIKLGFQRNITEDHWGRNFATVDPPRFVISPVRGRASQRYNMWTGYTSYDFGSVLAESSTGYIDRKDTSVGPIVLGPRAFELDANAASFSFVQELRLVSQGNTALRYVVGAVYQDAKNLEDIAVVRGPPISSVSTYRSKSWAGFGELSYGFANDLIRPLIGLRYFRDDRDFTTQNRAPFVRPPYLKSATFDSFNPRFNLAIKPNDNMLFYVNVARGFRSGTFNTASAVAVSGGAVDYTVAPDSIWSYEAGTKLTLLDHLLYVEASVYQFDWQDVQLNYTVAGGVQVIRNAGNVRGRGFEYGVTLRPTSTLTLQATGNFNDTTFRSLVNPVVFAATPSIAVGRQVASVPKSHHTLSATWVEPLKGDDLKLLVNASYTYISKQGDPGDNLGRFGSSHDLVKARIGVQRQHWGAFLFGDNLLNDTSPIQVSGSGSTRYFPRKLGVELKFDY